MPRQRINNTDTSIKLSTTHIEINTFDDKYFEEVKRIVLKRIQEIDITFKTIKKGAVSYDKVDLLWNLQNECKNHIKQLAQYKLKHPCDQKMIDKLIKDLRRLTYRMFNLSISSQWSEIIRQYKISIETSSQIESIHALSAIDEAPTEDDVSEIQASDLQEEDHHELQIATVFSLDRISRKPDVDTKPPIKDEETTEQDARLIVIQVQDDNRPTITDHFEPEEQEQLELKSYKSDKQIQARQIVIREQLDDADEKLSTENIETARKRVATKITPVLDQLLRKINTIPQSSDRLQIALNLYHQLKTLADAYIKGDPRSESNKETFLESCNNLIDEAKPTFSKEPGWGEYLIILAQILANAVIRCLTVGYKQAFFTIPENIPQALESFKKDAEINDYDEDSQSYEDIEAKEISRLAI